MCKSFLAIGVKEGDGTFLGPLSVVVGRVYASGCIHDNFLNKRASGLKFLVKNYGPKVRSSS